MNKDRWLRRAALGEIDNDEFLAKLMEELGEVGNAYIERGRSGLLAELEHVEFIAGLWRMTLRDAA